MENTLRYFDVDVSCDQCGDFSVRADVIAESQRLLAEGCPGSRFECPPQLLATLLDATFLESLEKTGQRPAQTEQLALVRSPRGQTLRVVAVQRFDPRNIPRWEDDGGYCPPSPRREEPC